MHTIERALELAQAKNVPLTEAELTRKMEAGELQGEFRDGRWLVDETSLTAFLKPPLKRPIVWVGRLAAVATALALMATQAQTVLDFTCEYWTLGCKSTPKVAVLKSSIVLQLDGCPNGFEIPDVALARVRQGGTIIDFRKVAIKEKWKPIGTHPIFIDNQAGNYTGSQVVTPNYVHFRVERLEDYPEIPNALAAAECGGGGMESFFFKEASLHKSRDPYEVKSDFLPTPEQNSYKTFRIEPNEPVPFYSSLQCEESGIYLVSVSVNYQQGGAAGVAESAPVEVYCPGEILNYDSSLGQTLPVPQTLQGGFYDYKR
ncbi:hypothetical protein ACI3L1_08250 [Deinococcus sp. SM5_A1]|uniref:hypothetical protein n=1 Tax=Deinococcus sp. SM5_A1 TaxID=3379094 RepID=UPI00385A073C